MNTLAMVIGYVVMASAGIALTALIGYACLDWVITKTLEWCGLWEVFMRTAYEVARERREKNHRANAEKERAK